MLSSQAMVANVINAVSAVAKQDLYLQGLEIHKRKRSNEVLCTPLGLPSMNFLVLGL